MRHWAVTYIGLPWEVGARGPALFDCWSLVVWIYKHHFGHILPDIPVAEGNLKQLAMTFRDHSERERWRLVHKPKEGDAVLMRQSKHPIHVGVWINISATERGVLHCVKGNGVVFQSLSSLLLTWQIAGFYRIKAKAH